MKYCNSVLSLARPGLRSCQQYFLKNLYFIREINPKFQIEPPCIHPVPHHRLVFISTVCILLKLYYILDSIAGGPVACCRNSINPWDRLQDTAPSLFTAPRILSRKNRPFPVINYPRFNLPSLNIHQKSSDVLSRSFKPVDYI